MPKQTATRDPANLFPRELPEGLTTQQCYEFGLRYTRVGWWEIARKALKASIALDHTGKLSSRAEEILSTELPKLLVSPEAEELSNQANNFIINGNREQAKVIVEQLTRHYPNFEHPFRQLAIIELANGDIEQAKSLAKYLTVLNDQYIGTLELLAAIAAAEKDYRKALEFLNRYLAHRSEPPTEEFKFRLKILLDGMPPDICPQDLDAQSFYELGELYAWRWQFDLAREASSRLRKIDSVDIFAKKSERLIKTRLPLPMTPAADQLLMEAFGISDLPERNKALTDLMTKEKSEIAAFALAETFYFQEDIFAAIEVLEVCHNINPYFERAKRFMIDLLCIDNQFNQALDFIEDWIQEEPENSELEWLKATIEMRFYIDYKGSSTKWGC